jgi:amino acid transporter
MSAPDYEKKDAELGVAQDTSSNELHADYHTSKEANSELSFWTRMGCTPESFKRRTLEDKHNQLNQTLKKRHLHMIAVSSSHKKKVTKRHART